MNGFYGAKYDKMLSTPEIAKRVRADVKAAKADKDDPLPAVTVSVRSRSFSGGTSIDVNVTAFPAGWKVFNDEYLKLESEDPYSTDLDRMSHYSDETAALLARLDAMLNAYNRDLSDSQTDYFNVKFYDHVGIDSQLERLAKSMQLADLNLLRKAA
jgi:hypothetical protein